MEIETILPWQHLIWESLHKRHTQDRLPHALLFAGSDGVGKNQFAKVFANYLLCQSPSDMPCGQCRACHLIQAKSHPDFKLIEPEEAGQMIKIDQIRDVVSFVNETALLGGYRVVVINPASAMNINAANALLKSLEEPTPKTILILICNQSMRLPSTISSRCQRIIFSKPSPEAAFSWLQNQVSVAESNLDDDTLKLLLNLTEGAPLKVNELLANDTLNLRKDLYQGLLQLSYQQRDPLQLAAAWQEKQVHTILDLLLSWLRDLLRFKLSQSDERIINIDYQIDIDKLSERLTHENLLQYMDQVQQTYARMLSSLNINRQLLLEEIFIHWVKLCS